MQPEQSDKLVIALRSAARDLVAHRSISDLEQTLDYIVAAAVDTVPGADAGGISMTENGHITSRSPTNEDVHKLDDLQALLHEGPCITAVEEPPEDGVILARDLAEGPDADRWPHFAPQAVEHGYRSLMSTQLSTNGGTHAALNLYSHTPEAFDDSARTIAGLFGVQAGLLIYGANHVAQLSRALHTRDAIGQAKGILMERFGVEGDQAFQMLVRSSQDTNVKLVDVAHWLTAGAGSQQAGAGGDRPHPPADARG
ncbi:GAF and ANTAR domain-containing protein [Pseudonocardia sp. H11422]|uniref:GAF and ANTAR domain-containing protein n=1 Tax=Pseudonocardia sp. H11422 TaxID=2835866 RepID=UPI001BDDB06C|nr:GAF and ANTAR domain-containing protein [Pseudonocardia sp. H11422]